jgi:hypothetical protein
VLQSSFRVAIVYTNTRHVKPNTVSRKHARHYGHKATKDRLKRQIEDMSYLRESQDSKEARQFQALTLNGRLETISHDKEGRRYYTRYRYRSRNLAELLTVVNKQTICGNNQTAVYRERF